MLQICLYMKKPDKPEDLEFGACKYFDKHIFALTN